MHAYHTGSIIYKKWRKNDIIRTYRKKKEGMQMSFMNVRPNDTCMIYINLFCGASLNKALGNATGLIVQNKTCYPHPPDHHPVSCSPTQTVQQDSYVGHEQLQLAAHYNSHDPIHLLAQV
eukprot:1101929_1